MTSNQARAFSIALGIHVLIVLIMMYIFFTIPDPPFAEGLAGGGGGGSFVEFGTVDFNETTTPETAPPPVVAEDDKQLMTSDVEQTVQIDQPDKEPTKKPEKVKPKEQPKVKPKEQPVVAVALPQVVTPKVDPRAMYKPGNKGSSGSPDGSQSGNGTGGTGTGNGGGNGSGNGPGSGGGDGGGNGGGHGPGNGIYFDLAGRSWISRPRIDDRSQEQGKVVIDIVVDKTGKVVSATGPGRGSTTTSSALVAKAKEAALRATFSGSPNGVEEQRGSITFNFVLR